jgi:pimeloyl-ACP methyl ester carboxylesterase
MRIVIVHGRAAEMEIPALMAAEWEAALWWGQERLGSGLTPGSLDVRLAFYGDLWRPDRLQPLPRIEPEVILEGIGFSDISMWFDRLGVGDVLLDHLLHDVEDYFTVRDLRGLVNRRLVDVVNAEPADPEGTIVVGFSMGSLVAYDTLRQDPGLGVGALLTIGSPLAMPSFYKRLAALGPTPFPEQLRLWVNVWTKDDPGTAGHVDFAARFLPAIPGGPGVQDVETWGRAASPTNPAGAHNAIDYLSSRVFARALQVAVDAVRAG